MSASEVEAAVSASDVEAAAAWRWGRPARACARWRQRAGGGGVLRRVDVEAVATSELEAAAAASCRGAAVTSGGGGSRV